MKGIVAPYLLVTFLVVGVLAAGLTTAKAVSYDNWFWADPPYYKATHVGETFSVSVKVNVTAGEGGHGMYGYSFKFYWDRNLLNATDCTVTPPED